VNASLLPDAAGRPTGDCWAKWLVFNDLPEWGRGQSWGVRDCAQRTGPAVPIRG